MKKVIPVLIAIVLIVVVIGTTFGKSIYEKYSYSNERKDMNEYFTIIEEGQIPIILQDDRSTYSGKLIDGTVYIDYSTMKELLNQRFYYDQKEGLLLYALPNEMVTVTLDSTSFLVGNRSVDFSKVIVRKEEDTIYIAIDFIKQYSDFDYTFYADPGYMQIYTEWYQIETTTLNEDTALRYQGGVKSPILEELEKGSPVTILEVMDTWTKVKSESSLIGYVENKFLGDTSTVERIKENTYVEPEYSSILLDDTICLGWHAIGGKSGNTTISDVLPNDSPVNVISPTWFHLTDNEGNFESFASQSYVDYAHARGVQVWALISGIEYKESNGLNPYELLAETSKRTVLISNIINEVLTYGIDGVNVDFESISQESAEPFIEFIRELSIACRANGIILSIDNYVPKPYNMFYNREEQGIFADYVIIMGYDEHIKTGGVVGSVASFDFVSEGITETLKEVPAEKVINGMPFYTVRWETSGAEITGGNIDMEEAEDFVRRNNLEIEWDSVVGQNYASYETESTVYEIWLEDEDSIKVRLNLASMNQLAGVAVWRLGYEKPEIWDVFREYLGTIEE